MVSINKQEKSLLLKNFPNMWYNRTQRNKSKRHRYLVAEEKDILRFLSGMDKTQKDFNTKKINVVVKGSPIINTDAIRAFEMLLLNNIKYYKGEVGGMSNDGELLSEEQITRSTGLRKFCEYELSQLRKKYKYILRKQ